MCFNDKFVACDIAFIACDIAFITFVDQVRLINLKCHIDYFSKGPKSSRTDRTQKRRSFRVNSILSFRNNEKHETQHVGQLISIKGHTI